MYVTYMDPGRTYVYRLYMCTYSHTNTLADTHSQKQTHIYTHKETHRHAHTCMYIYSQVIKIKDLVCFLRRQRPSANTITFSTILPSSLPAIVTALKYYFLPLSTPDKDALKLTSSPLLSPLPPPPHASSLPPLPSI